MPKVATPKPSPTKRTGTQTRTPGSSPTKSGSPRKKAAVQAQVQDRSQWRSSRIREDRTIHKSGAMANYHLNAQDMQGIPFTREQASVRVNGVDRIVPKFMYKERDVELKAWEKHGGPEGFEKLLTDKMAKFYDKHGTTSGKFFPKPNSYKLPNDPMAGGYVAIVSRPKHLPDAETCTPTLIRIKEAMVARGEKWLWDALNKCIFDVECQTEYGPTLKRGEREALMLAAFRTLEDYPKRPTSPPPSDSASFKALTELLDGAPAVHDTLTTECDDGVYVHEDGSTGDRSVDWEKWYKDKVHDCLDKVVEEHGLEGWGRARWLVYDKYVECNIGGLEYSMSGGMPEWYADTAKYQWLDSRNRR